MSLEISQISKRIANKWIFRDISIAVPAGGIFGVCGAAGSGKSAILKTISGKWKTNGGSIKNDGIDVTTANKHSRGFASLPATERSLFSEILRLEPKASSGQQQLIEFEKIIESGATVLLLDDPFCHLDRFRRERCLDKLRTYVAGRDRIVIFASSDFRQIAAVADQAAVLSDGYFVQTGSPREIYENPETIAAAQLTGDVNLFQARRVSSTSADLSEFQTIEGSHRIVSSYNKVAGLGAINQNISLAIRPENISMSMGASFPEDNLLKAVVTGIRFLGATSLIEFDAGGIKLQARVFRVVGLNLGDECMLGLPPRSIRVLKQ